MITRQPARRLIGRVKATLCAALVMAATIATAQDTTWELRVCAPPQSLPFSDMDEPGFENRIVEILADELDAHVTFEWIDFTEDLINLRFAEGECDLIAGVPDGFGRGLNTLTYYASPYVVVYRADAGFEIDSLDDPDLERLDIGVHGAGTPPHTALLRRELLRNVTRVYGGSAGRDDRLGVLVQAVESGEIDVGFGWGPGTSYWALRSEADLVVKPVEPMFEPPSTFQVQPMTMAVRRDDFALETALNRAMVERWEEIQAVLSEYGVPVVEAPAPFAGEVVRPDAPVVVDVGVVLPAPTGGRTYYAAINDFTGLAAVRGALMAQGAIESAESESGVALVFHYASSPSAEAAERAAERLVLTADVDVIVGGVGAGQAEVLAAVAAEHGKLFLDVGAGVRAQPDDAAWNAFDVGPSTEAYVQAIVAAARRAAPDRPLDWFVVHLDEPGATELGRDVLDLFHELGERVVDGMAVRMHDPTYEDAYARLERSGADAVLVLLPATEQLVFMGNYQDRGGEALLFPFPDEPTQTRNFLAASAEYGVAVDAPRVVAWETTLVDGRAREFNERYTSRFGQPADPTAWTTYEALRIVQQAAAIAGTDAPRALADVLSSGHAFSTAKGALSFDERGQLAGQSVYVLQVVPSAVWGPTLSQQLPAARLMLTVVPQEAPERP